MEERLDPRNIVFAAALAAVTAPAHAQAPDPNLGRDLAATCANCHGTNGVSQGVVASLAGTPKADIVDKMNAFRDGKRPATIMHQLAKGYTPEQVAEATGRASTDAARRAAKRALVKLAEEMARGEAG